MDESDLQLIEDYLNGDLKNQALNDFEQRLQTDKALAEELQLHRKVEYWLKKQHKEQLQQEWKTLIKQQEPLPAQKIRTLTVVKWAAGLAASLLIGMAFLSWFNSSPSPATLADAYWKQSANFTYKGTERSTSLSPTEKALSDAYLAYKNKYYRSSLDLLEKITPLSDQEKLLQGANYFALQQFDTAVETFEAILQDPNSYTKDQARWYLALSLLALEQTEKAKPILQKIVNEESWQAEKAQELLNDL
ncbi:MAG: hypothetical protein AAF798_09345 [Bacteroidota bacterium]